MSDDRTPKKPNDEFANENMQKRVNNLFSGEQLPAYESIREVDAMKARIRELETELAKKPNTDDVPSLKAPVVAPTTTRSESREVKKESATQKKSWLPAFLSAPVFPDDVEKTQSAKLLYQIITVIWILPLLLVTIGTLGGRSEVFPPAIVISTSLLILMGLTRIGWVRAAGTFITAMIILVFAYADYQNAGNIQPSTLIIAVAIIMSGLLLGRRAPLLVAILVAISHGIIVNLQMQGAIELQSAPAVGFENIIITGIMTFVVGFLFQFVISRLHFALDQARQDERELQISNRELQDLGKSLELRVTERTHDLELATEVGRAISEKIGNLQDLLTQSVELIRSNYKLYYTQLYLLDASGRNLVLRAGTGEVGKQLLQRGHRLAVSANSLNSRAVSTEEPILVADTKKNTNFLPNPLLPHTRSELSVPLIFNGKVIGVLDMQSDKPETFSEANIPAFEVLTGQLGVAIQNSILFNQTEESRLVVQEQARRLTSSGWQGFLNAVDRSESLGYVLNQEEILPMTEIQETPYENKLVVPIQVTGTDVGEIQLVGEANRQWSSNEAEIVQAAMEHVAQHIENLRLLSQAEKYRAEAEQVSRRLTNEGWQEFLRTRKELADGYIYNKNQVQPLNGNGNKSTPALSFPLVVRDEEIGNVELDSLNDSEADPHGLVTAVLEKLSNHIESLRLLEQTELSRIDVQKSQERFELAVRGSDDGVWDWNIAEDTIYYSPRWKSMLGFEEHELTRGFTEWEERIHPEDKDRATKALEDYLAQKSPEYDVELRLKHKDGHYVWIRDRGKALRREDGTAYRMAGAHTDISERKQNEDLIAQRANQLETVATLSTTASTVLNPDALLQQVVNLTKSRFNLYHAHVYLLDENWNTLLLAAGAGEVGVKMVEAGHAIDSSAKQSFVARAAREKQAVVVNDVRNEEGFLPNESLPNTRAEMAIPMIVGDNVLGVFDVQSDIVDAFSREDANIYSTLASQVAVALQNARLYQEQSATVTQLRELDRLKSSFLANMSHELRTPLNSILGFTDVMLEGLDGPLTPNMDNDLKLINKNGQHLLHLINDVLDMAKIESGKMNLIIEKFNLNEIFEEVISITSPQASEKKLTLKVDTKSDQNVDVSADRTRLRQVMINLVNNALKFTEKGKIIIRAIREENNVLISVKDTGIGIPAAQLEDVFSEFTQVDSSTTRKAGGTGLGLPISRKLIEMHGGKLWAESNGVEGEGSTFFVFMPLESKSAVSEPVARK